MESCHSIKDEQFYKKNKLWKREQKVKSHLHFMTLTHKPEYINKLKDVCTLSRWVIKKANKIESFNKLHINPIDTRGTWASIVT